MDGNREIRRAREAAEFAQCDGPAYSLITQICLLAAAFFNVPMAFMSVIDATHHHVVARHGLGPSYAPRGDTICDLTIRENSPFIIEDALADPLTAECPLVTGDPRIRFYAGIPLILTPGLAIGTFCVADTSPRRIGQAEIATLRSLADLVIEQLRHHANKSKLARQSIDFEWMANHDPLTGLLNRTALAKHAEGALLTADTDDDSVALLILDIDKFKLVNDTLGQEAGDAVLCAVAARLENAAGTEGTLARIGGDEFAIIVTGFTATGTMAALSTKILLALRRPIAYAGTEIDIRATIGIAIRSPSTTCASDLFKEADIALSNARDAGSDGFAFYRPAMSEALKTKMASLAAARTAVMSGNIEPFYQPKIHLETNEILGFEALLRWRHPTHGLSGPGAMGDVFADSEIAVAIGREMLNRIVVDMIDWQRRKLPFGHVAINIAEPEFHAGDYAERLLACLDAHQLTTDMLEVEVTESVFLGQRSGIVARTLQKLCAAGIAIALDDFGTGYASLTHLKQYPVSAIKIDRSFTSEIETNANAATIVEAVTSLANSLKIGAVAEGIETSRQLAFLRARRCAVGQGYLFARPMPASRIPYFLRHWRSSETSANARAAASLHA
jgi:diguanylate cyclase (GGDEF)-like protein